MDVFITFQAQDLAEVKPVWMFFRTLGFKRHKRKNIHEDGKLFYWFACKDTQPTYILVRNTLREEKIKGLL